MATADSGLVNNFWRTRVNAWSESWGDDYDNIRIQAILVLRTTQSYITSYYRASVWIDGLGLDTGLQPASPSRFQISRGQGGTRIMIDQTWRVGRVDYARTLTCGARIDLSQVSGGTAEARVGVDVGAKVVNIVPPNGVSWANFIRVDDYTTHITWGLNADNNAGKFWRRTVIAHRWKHGEDQWTNWSDQPGSNTDLRKYEWPIDNADWNTNSNECHQWAIYAENEAGTGPHRDSWLTYTTPSKPKSIKASRIDATSARIEYDCSGTMGWTIDLERSTDQGATWTVVKNGINLVGALTGTFTDTNVPKGGTVRYRGRIYRWVYGDGTDNAYGAATGDGSYVFSEWTESEDIKLQENAKAPTDIILLKDTSSNTATISWKTNHPDGSGQTGYSVVVAYPSGRRLTLRETNTSATVISFHADERGTYWFRVATSAGNGVLGAFSEAASKSI